MHANRIFISYSHESENDSQTPRWKAELASALKVFTDQNLIDAWDDERIPGGYKWFKEINKAIHEARVAILLLTEAAFKSEFILEHEFKPLSKRKSNQLLVFPILCEACAWDSHPWLKQLQIRPFEAKPLANCSDSERTATWRRLSAEIAEELSRIALSELPGDTVAPANEHVYIEKFPLTHGPALCEKKLIGREQELALLDLAFAQPHTAIVSLVAWGGVGKTMLAQHWLLRLEKQGWFGTQRVYAWSFYSQGTKEDRQASEDLFLTHALQWFGVQCEPTLSPWDKGRLLADAVAHEHTLLILDGIEPLQYPPGPMGGQLHALGVQSLLKHFAKRANSAQSQVANPKSPIANVLCLVTTREPLTDLADFQRREGSPWGSVLHVNLGNLTDEAGAVLLHHAGANRAGPAQIKSNDKELLAASREVDGHALTLNLLGRFLSRAHQGNIRHRDRVKFEEADLKEQGGTTFRMLAAFENWFNRGSQIYKQQLSILRLLGLFDRPADSGCLTTLRKPPLIEGLNDHLFDVSSGTPKSLTDEEWHLAIWNLANFGLLVIQPDPNGGGDALDSHPLIREYFAAKLKCMEPNGFKAAHSRLYDYLSQSTEPFPSSVSAMQPLFQAIQHGCHARRHQEALVEVFDARINRVESDDFCYAAYHLGAFSLSLSAASEFFAKKWDEIATVIDHEWKVQILGLSGFLLWGMARLSEARQAIGAAEALAVSLKNWHQASLEASNLALLDADSGNLKDAFQSGKRAISYAERSGEWSDKVYALAAVGSASFLKGDMLQAEKYLNFAEVIQRDRCRACSVLFGHEGFIKSEIGLAEIERAVWQVLLYEDGQQLPKDGFIATLDALMDQMRQKQEFQKMGGNELQNTLNRKLYIAQDHLVLASVSMFLEALNLVFNHHELPTAETSLASASEAAKTGGEIIFEPLILLREALFCGIRGNFSQALNALDAAQDTAKRVPMPLCLADVHLHRARLFGRLQKSERESQFPSINPMAELAEARHLIKKHGYFRREGELLDAELAAESW